jgi:DNA polymerase-3 subunit delta
VPFLASNRLVIVEGLLAALGSVKGGRRTKKKATSGDDPLEPWRAAAAQLADPATMPPTTTLVLVESDIARSNAAFTIFAPIAQTVEFAPYGRDDAVRWLIDEAKGGKLKLSDRSAHAMVELCGSDLWLLHNELAKLAAFAGADEIDDAMVRSLVTSALDAKFWDMTDAVVAGNERKAISSLDRLLTEGEPAPLLAAMLVRQYRQLVLVKEGRERRMSKDEIARAASVPAFKVDQMGALASRYSWADLRFAYGRLLDADLSVKRGLQDDESALQLLVHELCALAPKGQSRPAYSR